MERATAVLEEQQRKKELQLELEAQELKKKEKKDNAALKRSTLPAEPEAGRPGTIFDANN